MVPGVIKITDDTRDVKAAAQDIAAIYKTRHGPFQQHAPPIFGEHGGIILPCQPFHVKEIATYKEKGRHVKVLDNSRIFLCEEVNNRYT